MPVEPHLRIVLDTNVVLRGLVSERSAAAKIFEAADARRFVTLLNKPVLDEYRAVLSDQELVERFPALTARRVQVALARLRFVGDYLRHGKATFQFPRDRRDAKFIALAIDGHATHLVSEDSDLLSLASGRGDSARRLRQRMPRLRVLSAFEFAKGVLR